MEFGAFKLVKMEETNGERIMGVRWVLRKKFGSDGKLSKAKARLVQTVRACQAACKGGSLVLSCLLTLYTAVMSLVG